MNRKVYQVLLFVVTSIVFSASQATESLAWGSIKELSYRGGYVMFKVVDNSGNNLCSACPTDPGLFGAGRCWIDGATKEQLSMLLMAKSQGKKISGRVIGFSTNCSVYQMTVED